MSDQSRDDRIRAKAYEIWEAAGMPEGQHDAHWLRAEQMVESEDTDAETLVADAGPITRIDRAASYGQRDGEAVDLRTNESPAGANVMHQQGIGG